MKRSARWLAAFLLMFLLPVQGLAAACAQICAQAQAADHSIAHDCHEPMDADESTPTMDGKCCYAHTFVTERPADPVAVAVPSFQPVRFVARWTSFIPEEPSPPPIAPAA